MDEEKKKKGKSNNTGMLVSSHHLSQRGTRKGVPKAGQNRREGWPGESERERTVARNEIGSARVSQSQAQKRGGFAYFKVERRTHTTVHGLA